MFTIKHIEYGLGKEFVHVQTFKEFRPDTLKDFENQACIFELAKVRIVSKQSFGGITPLMTAAKSNNVNCVAYLLSIGAKIDAVDNCGRRASNYTNCGDISHRLKNTRISSIIVRF